MEGPPRFRSLVGNLEIIKVRSHKSGPDFRSRLFSMCGADLGVRIPDFVVISNSSSSHRGRWHGWQHSPANLKTDPLASVRDAGRAPRYHRSTLQSWENCCMADHID